MSLDQIQGLVARRLATYGAQGEGGPSTQAGMRIGTRGEGYSLSPVQNMAVLADEGSYFTANNNQSGLATAASPNAFSATNPFIVLVNNAPAGAPGPLIVPHYIALVATAAGTAGTSLQCAVTKDAIARYTSGGTALTPQRPNTLGVSDAQLWAGNITAAAAGPNVQTIVGLRWLLGTIPVAGDLYQVVFGSVDGSVSQNKQTINTMAMGVAPLVLFPGETMLFYLWLPAQTAASSYAPEIAWWER